MEKEIFGTSQSERSSGAADLASQSSSEHMSIEVMREMVELADSGCLVYWPAELSLSMARQLLAQRLQGQPPAAEVEPECEPEIVFSSQELEAELEAQLELEGWL